MKLSFIGVQPKKEKQFLKRGIHNVEELVEYFPSKYKDFTHETGLLPPDQVSCVSAVLESVKSYTNGTPMVKARCRTMSGFTLDAIWFNQLWQARKLSGLIGRRTYIAGKAKYDETYRVFSMVSPDLFEEYSEKSKKILPIYKKVPGMAQEYLAEKMNAALGIPEAVAETCPPDVVKAAGLLPRKEALRRIHFPKSLEEVRQGQDRILFDELLYFALHITWAARNSAKGSAYNIKTLKSYTAICDGLTFALTEDQKAAIDGMIEHIRAGQRLNALLQGDVGCGKSIVAFILMAVMADSGYQSAIMAPTQVLARQHYDDLSKLMAPLGYNVVYLGGSDQKAAEKKKVLASIANGTANMVVGTHAIIGKAVQFKKLALTIADEEHRFGVAQRAALVEKAQEGVHSITMSATPIPRSLAQVVYGDAVQLFTIKTMPIGRKPVITGLATGREKIYRFIIGQARKGLQTYVVCPMIDRNEDMKGVKSVEEISAEYTAALNPYGIRIEALTGRDSKERTEEVICKFRNGQIDVLIATTIIEVGVNVPTATTIVVTNAERFGLSTLHQLRGRVGRGYYQSYCVLESESQTEEGRARLSVMCETTDGFKIAEADLKIRGAGNFLGTQQSGDNKYMSLMLAYPKRYEYVKRIATTLLDRGEDCCPLVARVIAERKTETGERSVS